MFVAEQQSNCVSILLLRRVTLRLLVSLRVIKLSFVFQL